MLAFLVVAGGILLAMLVSVSTIVDNRFRAIHQGGSIGFTSMLIIVRFLLSYFCFFCLSSICHAVNVMLLLDLKTKA